MKAQPTPSADAAMNTPKPTVPDTVNQPEGKKPMSETETAQLPGNSPTERQIHDSRLRVRAEANRANARRSTGPKDTSGTRFNALTHGLLASGVTELDDPAAYGDLLASLNGEHKPVGTLETFLGTRPIILRHSRALR